MFSLALANEKGGVGKTTNTVNIAGALASRGHDVLVVDFDPQGYLTMTLGFREAYREDSPSLADALLDPDGVDREALVREHPEFDVVPGSGSLDAVARRLAARDAPGFGTVRRFLEAVADGRYDVVVVDTPPARNAFTDAVLVDCADLFVPMEVSEPSIYSIHALIRRIVDLQEAAGASIRIRAVLLSDVHYPMDNEQQRVVAWVEDNFGGQCPVYEIRSRAAIQRSLTAHGSIFGADAEPTDMRGVYEDIAAQVERLHPGLRSVAGGDR